MKLKHYLLLCSFVLFLLTASCMKSSTQPVPPDLSTGQYFLREGKGIRVLLEILPDTETTGWIARVNLHSEEQQDGLRVSISSRSSFSRNCSLEIKEGSQTAIPSEYSPTIMSWDLDIAKDQSLVFTVLLGNCSDTSKA